MTDPIKYVYAHIKGEIVKRRMKMRKADAADTESEIEKTMHGHNRFLKRNTRKIKIPTKGRHIR